MLCPRCAARARSLPIAPASPFPPNIPGHDRSPCFRMLRPSSPPREPRRRACEYRQMLGHFYCYTNNSRPLPPYFIEIYLTLTLRCKEFIARVRGAGEERCQITDRLDGAPEIPFDYDPGKSSSESDASEKLDYDSGSESDWEHNTTSKDGHDMSDALDSNEGEDITSNIEFISFDETGDWIDAPLPQVPTWDSNGPNFQTLPLNFTGDAGNEVTSDSRKRRAEDDDWEYKSADRAKRMRLIEY
ncbi:hypothetical protein R3P38DRAFT_3473632 [Favolaschia claudopus]|uniref:Uncharacterized protein n=1 Tax=Favolaschia claudopus TaxID=2862362 RepID=A0AAV9ZCJ5_9AGAR